jgi:hypothetical protein
MCFSLNRFDRARTSLSLQRPSREPEWSAGDEEHAGVAKSEVVVPFGERSSETSHVDPESFQPESISSSHE